MRAPICHTCNKLAKLKKGISYYRRGKKGVHVPTQYWECPSDCIGPDGSKPYKFHDAQSLKANDAEAQREWKEFFGEEMPVSAFRQ